MDDDDVSSNDHDTCYTSYRHDIVHHLLTEIHRHLRSSLNSPNSNEWRHSERASRVTCRAACRVLRACAPCLCWWEDDKREIHNDATFAYLTLWSELCRLEGGSKEKGEEEKGEEGHRRCQQQPRHHPPVAALALALCCHHLCDYQGFVAQPLLQRHGLGAAEFSLMRRLATKYRAHPQLARKSRRGAGKCVCSDRSY